MLLWGAISALLIHVLAMYVPFLRSVLHTAPVSLNTWMILAALALTVLVAIEIHKFYWNRRHRTEVSSS